MNEAVSDRARGPAGLGATLLLLGTLGPAGCDDPARNTVQVSPEARERLMPKVGDATDDGKEASAVPRVTSIKDRGKLIKRP